MKQYLDLLHFQWQKEMFIKIFKIYKQKPNKGIVISNFPYRYGKVYFRKILKEAIENETKNQTKDN